MSVTGNEGGSISHTDAQSWISSFQSTYPNEIFSNLFGKNVVASVMSQQGCCGLKIYNALDTSGVKKLILYGVNSSGTLLTGYIAEYASQCPPNCQ
jgi:hypothetical protein